MTQFDHSQALLAWIANSKSGTHRELREKIDWILSLDQNSVASSRTVINSLGLLGYIQISTGGDYWESCPPTIVLLPGAEGLLVLTGCLDRNRIEEAIVERDLWLTALPPTNDTNLSPFLPNTMYLESSNSDSFLSFVDNYGCQTIDVSRELESLALEPIGLPTKKAGGPRFGGDRIERFNLDHFSYVISSSHDGEGLYRQRSLGKLKYWIFDGNQWFSTDRGRGPWQAMTLGLETDHKTSAISYLPNQDCLMIRRGIALPRELHVLLVLCSGMLPTIESDYSRFDNFNSIDADSVFRYLNIN